MRTSPRLAGLAALTLGGVVALAPLDAEAAHPGSTATTASHAVAAPHAKPGWRLTKTGAIAFKGTKLGATPNRKTLHLQVVLAPRHVHQQEQLLLAQSDPTSSHYRHYLSPAQYRARFAPTAADAALVTGYLHQAGLTGVRVAGNRMLVSAHGPVGVAEKAFATRLVSYRTKDGVLFANRTPAQVPAALGSIVRSVSGLTDYQLHTGARHVTPRATTSAGLTLPSIDGFTPKQFQTTYDAVGTATGEQTSIAILTQGDISQVVPDLRTAEATYEMPTTPVTTIQTSAAAAASTDAAGLGEWDMDTQSSSGMATNVKQMYLYNVATLSTTDIMSGINAWVSDDKAPAMSASIGGCEVLTAVLGDEAATDQIQLQGALQGQSLFASSGDAGYACSLVINLGVPAGLPQVEWPASGFYTTSVGGTSLLADTDANRILEPAWISGGGGTSEFESAPAWTKATNPLNAAGLRAVPDISLDADPDTAPVKVIENGAETLIGGTSLSSPLMLGVWARLQSAHANKLGLASMALYHLYTAVNPGTSTPVGTVPTVPAAAVPGFDDVTVGTNGLYVATPGWDYTTGLGTPDVKELVAALS